MRIDKSFAVARTNPALTTNVKLMTNVNGELYLESFAINNVLSQKRFRGQSIKKNQYLFEKIPEFFQEIEAEIAFATANIDDYNVMYDDFAQQYDDTYFSGATSAQNTEYEQEYEYLAPLWINQGHYPKAFMIFRIDGTGLELQNDSSSFRREYLDKWKSIEFFDMSEGSNLGDFIRTNFEHSFFPKAPMELSFEDDVLSSINGIDYEKTGYVRKSINLEQIKKMNTPQFKTEEQFTSYYKEFGVIMPHLINLSFLYDDSPADEERLKNWSINRYAGFYLDAIEEIKSVSPYNPFSLQKTDLETIEDLSPEEAGQIPYIFENIFVKEISGVKNSFDPILGGWDTKRTYWVEWKGDYYRIERAVNERTDVFGTHLYRIISDKEIKNESTNSNQIIRNLEQRVIIDELNTLKNKVKIDAKIQFEDIVAKNVLSSVNETIIEIKKNIIQYTPSGSSTPIFGYTIKLESSFENNLFEIPMFDECDLHFIEIMGKKHLIKKYQDDVPDIGGLYYIDADQAIEMNEETLRMWVNSGNQTRDPEYYSEISIPDASRTEPPSYKIYRASFLDLADFDFDRSETRAARYEYERENELLETMEEKLYLPERRDLKVTLFGPQRLTMRNFTNQKFLAYLSSDKESYVEWKNSTITSSGQILSFDTFEEYIQFKFDKIINNEQFLIDGQPNRKLKGYKAMLPLLINPKRIPVMQYGKQARDPDTNELLWQTDWRNGRYKFTPETELIKKELGIERRYYREEGYRYVINQEENQDPEYIDFISTIQDGEEVKLSTPGEIYPDLVFGEAPMPEIMTWNPTLPASDDPNEEYDRNYVPVTSEYVSSEELFEIKTGNTIGSIWAKNQWVCKWSVLGSLSTYDYPERLGFSLETNGETNNAPKADSELPYAVRKFRDLDYFYRFGIPQEAQESDFYSLHLKETYFDIDEYLSENDYFDWLFNSDQPTARGIQLTNKHSTFYSLDEITPASSVFNGVMYTIYDVDGTQSSFENDVEIVEDWNLLSNAKYSGYKFSIVFGRKLSIFQNNSGDGSGDFGIDVYLNDRHKNIVIHIYIETNNTLTFREQESGNTFDRNLETSVIDDLYAADLIAEEASNPDFWDDGKIRIDGDQDLSIRIRDFKLSNFMAIMSDPNYAPEAGTGRKPINWIHIYEDGTSRTYDATNKDFHIELSLGTEFLNREESFRVSAGFDRDLEINNSKRNQIILSDADGQLITNDGLVSNSLPSIDVWAGLPVSRRFDYVPATGGVPVWDLDEDIDPFMKRFSGPYMPIFKKVSLFRPISHWVLTQSNQQPYYGLGPGNWKFYDDTLFNDETDYLIGFGWLSEIIISKVNRQGNILQLESDGNPNSRSIFPMVDEWGYSYVSKYMFETNWSEDYFFESRRISLPENEYPGIAGYSIFLDGQQQNLIIEDAPKLNLVIDGFKNLDQEVDFYQDFYTPSSPTQGNTYLKIRITDVSKSISAIIKDVINDTEQTITSNNPTDTSVWTSSSLIDSANYSNGYLFLTSTTQLEYQINSNDVENTNGEDWSSVYYQDPDSTIPSRKFNVDLSIGSFGFTISSNQGFSREVSFEIPKNSLGEFNFDQQQFEDSIENALDGYVANQVNQNGNNLTFTIEAESGGPEYNFEVFDLINAEENNNAAKIAKANQIIRDNNLRFDLDYKGLQGQISDNEYPEVKCAGIEDVTIEFWFRALDFKKSDETILYKGSIDSDEDWSWQIRRDGLSNNICFATRSWILDPGENVSSIVEDLNESQIDSIGANSLLKQNNPTTIDVLTASVDVNDATWHHVACIFNSNTKQKKIYVDGVLSANKIDQNFTNIVTDGNLNILQRNWPLFIGSSSRNGVKNFAGNLDEIRLWNYARTENEIKQNQNFALDPNSFGDPERSLMLYYRFDQRSLLEIEDLSNPIREIIKRENRNKTTTDFISKNTSINTSKTDFEVESAFQTSNIIIETTEELEYEVSGAELQGFNDERYSISVPPARPVIKSTTSTRPKRKPGRYKVTFERPDDPIPNPPSVDLPSNKKVNPANTTNRTRSSLRSRPRFGRKPNNSWYKSRRNSRISTQLNGLDRFNKTRRNLLLSNSNDDAFKLLDRIREIRENPLKVIQRRSKIDRNPDQRRLRAEKRNTGFSQTFRNLISKPLKRIFRR